MRTILSSKLLALLAATWLCFASPACSDGDTAAPAPDAPELSDLKLALVTSAARVPELDSAQVEFEWEIDRDQFHLEGKGKLLVASTKLHLDERYEGQGSVQKAFRERNTSELLVLGEQAYLRSPAIAADWILFTPQELGEDWTVLRRLLRARSPLDYGAVVVHLSGAIANVGREKIEGRAVVHLRASIDAGELFNAFADAYGSQGQVMLANRFTGELDVDFWIDPSTLLPRRVIAAGEVPYLNSPTRIRLHLDYTKLNGVDEFIDAPKDAKPLSELR